MPDNYYTTALRNRTVYELRINDDDDDGDDDDDENAKHKSKEKKGLCCNYKKRLWFFFFTFFYSILVLSSWTCFSPSFRFTPLIISTCVRATETENYPCNVLLLVDFCPLLTPSHHQPPPPPPLPISPPLSFASRFSDFFLKNVYMHTNI